MLSEQQLKAVQFLATGNSVKETCELVDCKDSTLRGWLRNNSEFVKSLSDATDMYASECLKGRSRAYRVMAKKITDKLLQKIENDDLDNLDVMDLMKLLEKAIATMNSDENAKKISNLTAIQQNIQINNQGTNDKLSDPEMVKKFGNFLIDLNPEVVENVIEAKTKADDRAERIK